MKNTNNHVDWYSFSVLLLAEENALGDVDYCLDMGAKRLTELLGERLFADIFDTGGWYFASGRKPYRAAYKQQYTNLTIYCGGQNNILIECSGVTVAQLEKHNLLLPLLSATKQRSTRLDIALDFTDTTASELQACFKNERVTARAYQNSTTGETFYLGSQKSDRFVRVYEYYAPNPRAGKPRIEFQLKKENAENAIHDLLANGVSDTAQKLLNSSKFELPIRVAETDETISAYRKDRKMSKTMRWIQTTVASSIKRAILNGEIEDPIKFFETWFLPEERKNND